MSDLTLRINADFEKAQKAFNDLASTSEETREKMEKYAKTWENNNIDGFIDKQKLLTTALTGTRGETQAMQNSVNNYQKEIERLIKNGLNPNHEVIQKLVHEQDLLKVKIEETNKVQKLQEDIVKGAEMALKASFAVIGSGIAALAAMTQNTAKMGDQFAKTSRVVGLTAETLQELDYAAKQSGINNLTGHLEKLNKSMIDVKNDTGTLTKYLNDNNKELLNQLKNVKNNDEAFSLLIDEINKAPDELSRTELAIAAFGKAGQEMVLMAKDGVTGLSALREEARNYGIISNETAKASEDFITAQGKLKSAFEGVKIELTEGFIPGITELINRVTDFISGIDDWDKIFRILITTITTVTSALMAFVATMKIASIIQGVTTAIKAAGGALELLKIKILAVNTAIKANPIGLIASGIAVATGLIVGYITNAINKQKEYTNSFNENTNAVNRNARALSNLASIDNSKILSFPDRGMYNNVNELLEARTNNYNLLATARENFNRIGGAFYENQVKNYSNFIGQIETRLHELANLQGKVFNPELNKFENISTNISAQLPAIEIQTNVNPPPVEKIEEVKEKILTLQERLNQEIRLTNKQSLNEQISQVENFLKQRLELESDNHNEQINYLLDQKSKLLSLFEKGSMERIAIETAMNNELKRIQEEQTKFEQNLLETKLETYATVFGSLSKIISLFSEENEVAIAYQKSLAIADLAISTSVAIMRAWAQSSSWQEGLARTIALAAQGAAQTAAVIATSIPSKETGGRFIVPNGNRVDDKLYRFNGGEEINVIPRGMTNNSNNESFNFNFIFDGHIFSEIINKQARAGELYTLQLARNL